MAFTPGTGAVISMSVDGATETQRQIDNIAGSMSTLAARSGVSAAQMQNAMRMVPAQLGDIASQLIGGQSPLTILVQQGGQLRDMFGSASGAVRGVASSVLGMITPATLAAAAVGGLVYAYSKGSKEADAYNRAIVMSGNAAGTSANQLADMAREVGHSVGTQAEAAHVVAALASTGQVGSDNLKQFTKVAIVGQRDLGRSVEDTVKDFAELGKSPVEASQKLNEAYHYLTASTLAQIKALDEQGRSDDAAEMAQKAYATAFTDRATKIQENLGLIERGWQSAKESASKAWDEFLGIGRKKTPQQRLAEINAALADADQAPSKDSSERSDWAEMRRAGNAGNKDALRKERVEVQLTIDKEKWDSQQAAFTDQLTRATNDWNKQLDALLPTAVRQKKEIERVTNLGLAAGASDAEITKAVDKVKQGFAALNNTSLAQMESFRDVQKEVLAGQTSDLETQHNLQLVGDKEYFSKKRDLQLREIDLEIPILQKQAQLAGSKDDLVAREKALGTLQQLEQRRKNIINGAANATQEADNARTKAIDNVVGGWDRTIAAEKEGTDQELALLGKSDQARQVALAQVKLLAEAEKFVADQKKAGHPLTEQEISDLEKKTAASQNDLAVAMNQRAAAAGAQQLLEENRRYAANSIADEKARAAAVLELDAQVWRDLIANAGDGTEAKKRLQEQYETWYANRLKGAAAAVDLDKAKILLDIMSALDESAKSAAQGMADSFGKVGTAIGGLTTALSGYGRTQAAIAAQLASATKDAGGDQTKIQRANTMAAEASAQAQIKSYGDMASAAKGFFKENSAGYKVMQGAEKAFRAYEMAMALETMAKKIFFKETEVAANTALNGTKIVGEATATAASTGLAATEASAWGITAVVKAIASLPFPLNLAAGAATLAAVVGLGVAMVGGLGGGAAGVNPNSAEERQKAQGTGTVLGDPTAKSESMAHSLEIMQKNSDLELDYQNSMLSELKNISTALGGAAKGILQTTGIIGGSAFGTVALAENNLIGASHTKDITDSGVQFAGTFGQMRSGTGLGRQYETVHTTSDGGMFRSGWSRDDTNYKALSAEAMKPFTLIFDNMGDLLVDAGVKLGQDSMSLTNAINGISVDFGVSLRGLTGQDLTDALNAGVSVAFDKVTTQLFPAIQQFQKMGEGLGETLVRVASDVQGLDSMFASMGKTAGGMSIEAKERLVEASGGLDKFASSAKSFMQNFYSEAEQRDATKAKLNPVLAQYGLTTESPNAQKMFKEFVLGLDTSTAAGAKTYAMLMNLQQAFFDVTDAATGERKDLQDQLDQLTMTQTQLLEKQRYALAEANRPLFDMIQAAQKLADTSSSMAKFRDTAKSLGESLVTGTLSTLTPEQQYQELRNQYEKTKSAALAGDTKAQDALSGSLTAFLTASQKLNSGDSQYQADFAMAQQDSAAAASWASQQVDVAQAQLNAMNSQSVSLNNANTSLQTLVDTVKELKAANAELTQEIAGLRADQQRQTGDSITSNAEGQNHSAELIVSGLGSIITKAVTMTRKVELE